jgi:hypothetical protein
VDLIQAHERLLALDKQVDFVLYPDEGHVFIKINNILSAEMRRVAFLAMRSLGWAESGQSARLRLATTLPA